MQSVLNRILLKKGFDVESAELCSRLFTETSRDGVYSHGLNRFPRFIRTIENGTVKVHSKPEKILSLGSFERWDGGHGPGNLNAWFSMGRAIEIARKSILGCVGLAHSNHWMRGGTYGWQAADADMIGICFTNTMPNLPPWGGKDPRLGNNPLIISIPRDEGHIVLDIAMSQFSYGALASYRSRGEMLPFFGGFDENGSLTKDPAQIQVSRRPLPIGLWKGSGLALILDILATVFTGGIATWQTSRDPDLEGGISQVFIAIDIRALNTPSEIARIENDILAFMKSSKPARDGEIIFYPGERTLQERDRNNKEGIPVDPEIWKLVLAMQHAEKLRST